MFREASRRLSGRQIRPGRVHLGNNLYLFVRALKRAFNHVDVSCRPCVSLESPDKLIEVYVSETPRKILRSREKRLGTSGSCHGSHVNASIRDSLLDYFLFIFVINSELLARVVMRETL